MFVLRCSVGGIHFSQHSVGVRISRVLEIWLMALLCGTLTLVVLRVGSPGVTGALGLISAALDSQSLMLIPLNL